MKRFFKYELIEIVQDGQITTYTATEIASGRPVLFHMLTNTLDAAARDELIRKAQSLKGAANGESGILDAGEYVGFRYVVTEVLDTFLDLPAGIDLQSAQVLAGAAQPQAVSVTADQHAQHSRLHARQEGKPIPTGAHTDGGSDTAPSQSASSGSDSPGTGANKKIDISKDETVEFKLEELSRATQRQEPSTEDPVMPQPAEPSDAQSALDDKADGWFQLARQHFQTKEFREALSELEQVLEINPNHPEALNLRAEVRRQEEQNRHEEPRAATATSQTPILSPANPETSRPEEALMLLSEGQALCSQGRADEGLERLRQARQLDPNNALIPIVLVNSLIQRATGVGSSDWPAVERLAAEVLSIQPTHGIARTLHEKATEQKGPPIAQFRDEAQRLRAQGNIHGALAAVTEGLRQNPGESSLIAMGAELEKARDETKPAASEPPRDPQVRPARLNAIQAQVEARLREIARRHSGEAESKNPTDEILRKAEQESPTPTPSSMDFEAASMVTKALREPPRVPPSYSKPETPPPALSTEIPSRSDIVLSDYALQGPPTTPAREAFSTEIPSRSEIVLPNYVLQGPPTTPAPPALSTEIPSRSEIVLPDYMLQGPPTTPAPVAKSEVAKPSSHKAHAIKIQGSAAPAARKFFASLQAVGGLFKRTTSPSAVKAAVSPRSTSRKSIRLVLIALAVLVLLLTAATTLRKLRNQGATLATAAFPVQIQSQPPGASIAVDDTPCGVSNCALDLVSGNHVVTARLAGFTPATLSIGIDQQTPPSQAPFIVTLTPLPVVLRISSSLGRGQVSLDGQPVSQFDDGEYEFDLSSLSPGGHTLRIVERDTAVTIPFEAPLGSAPLVRGPIQARNLKAVVVAGVIGQMRVYSAASGQDVRLENNVIGKLGPDGLALPDLAEGSHKLTVGAGQEQQTVMFDVENQPTLAVYLGSDRNVGSLRILTAEDDVTIYLNGEKYRRPTQRGVRLIYLTPKAYTVRVEKNGFRPAPEQTAEVKKGEEARLTFELQPNPRAASLQVRNGAAGAEVFLDGRSIGTVRPDGGLTTAGITPGTHSIRIEKLRHKTKQLEKEFADGSVVEIDGALESSVGALNVQVLPAGVKARLKLRREGETSDETISDATQYLAPGTYTITAGAEGYQDYGATVRIELNDTKTVSLTLQPKEEKKQTQPLLQLADWEKAGGWRSENNVLMRAGGNFVLSPSGTGPGVYVFTARALKGGSFQWVANYVDGSNYVLYEINKNQFERTQVIKGDKKEKFRARHGLNGNGFVSVKVEITPDAVLHKVLKGDDWVVIDKFEQAGASFGGGKFGFYVPGRDEIGLSFFNFFPGMLQAGN